MKTDMTQQRLGTLVGSLRRESFSRTLAQSLLGLAPENVEILPLPGIGDLPLFNQDIIDEGGMPDAVLRLAEAIGSVDGVILVSPEYNWSIPGPLKNALDWLSRLNPNPLQDKPVVVFTSSPGLLGGARAHAPIRNVLHALGSHILARPEVQIAQVKAKVSLDPPAITDAATAGFIKERLTVFSAFAGRL
jgi:chromate reductase, NAD(P)H dehydrogenase (quinone)